MKPREEIQSAGKKFSVPSEIVYSSSMTQTYLNGRVSISSLAAPTEDDLRVLKSLSDEDKAALLAEALKRAEASGPAERTPEDIWNAAKARVEAMTVKNAV